MNRLRVLASLAVCLLPVCPLAEDAAAPPVAPAPAARWSLGGGVTFQTLGYVATGTPSILPLSTSYATVPSPSGTLERRLSDRSWMFLNVSGVVQRRRADVADGSWGMTRDDQRRLIATVGLRRVLTAPRAPVEVSTQVGVHGGVVDSEQRVTDGTGFTRTDETAWLAGASVGIAVQRELTSDLALRLSTPLLVGTYVNGRARSPGQPTRVTTAVTVTALITPQLELVLFF